MKIIKKHTQRGNEGIQEKLIVSSTLGATSSIYQNANQKMEALTECSSSEEWLKYNGSMVERTQVPLKALTPN